MNTRLLLIAIAFVVAAAGVAMGFLAAGIESQALRGAATIVTLAGMLLGFGVIISGWWDMVRTFLVRLRGGSGH